MKKEIIVATTLEVPGRKVAEVLGIVKGNTVRARHVGRDIMTGLKNVVGGEIKSYTRMSVLSREEAFNRMINEAIDMGADAIIGMDFSTSRIIQGACEMLAYGAAVKLK